jgi:glycosyltransferase involved in cell wall biosynthesis
MNFVRDADAFLSFGREGYGIPVLEAIQLGTPVFYDGTQPAAELMQGHGAYKTSIDQAFHAPLPPSVAAADQSYLPKWNDYARDIAQSLRHAARGVKK